MSEFLMNEMIRMADQLENDEIEQVIENLQTRLNRKKMSKEEFRRHLDAMTLDVGEISPDFSFNRED